MSDNSRPPKNSIHAKLEAFAQRGTHRGADEVLGAAMHNAAAILDGAARRDTIMSDTLEPIEPVESVDEIPVIDMQPRRARPSRRHRGIAAVGIVALFGVGGYATFASQGGGAESPRAAVQQLADAFSNEDVLAAVDVLAPGEVRSLKRSIERAADKAEQFEIIEDSTDPFRGFDVEVTGLTTEVETLADGFAKVTITGGVVENKVNPERLAPRFRDGEATDPAPILPTDPERIDLAESGGPNDEPLFVIVLREGGGWYVSPAYTAMEYARVAWAYDHDPVHVALGSAEASTLGADSPEAAVRDAAEALRAGDWERLIELAPPSELPVWEYRELLVAAIDEQRPGLITIDRLDLTADIEGSSGFVNVDGEGSYGDNGGRWQVSADCPPAAGVLGASSDGENDADICFRGDLWGLLFSQHDSGEATARVAVVEEDGRWFVSPVGTALDVVDSWIGGIDETTIAFFTGDYSKIEPEGTVTLGVPVTVQASRVPEAQVFTFEGTSGMEIVGQSSKDYGVNLLILGPDGEELGEGYGFGSGYPVTLPADGSYRLVVFTGGVFSYGSEDQTFTIWTVEDAPAGVVRDHSQASEFCYPTEAGEVCESVSSATTMAVQAPATTSLPAE